MSGMLIDTFVWIDHYFMCSGGEVGGGQVNAMYAQAGAEVRTVNTSFVFIHGT
jgi:hypothetical protein